MVGIGKGAVYDLHTGAVAFKPKSAVHHGNAGAVACCVFFEGKQKAPSVRTRNSALAENEIVYIL